jgi:tripartite-type tricarboxylate transporter receptor subunit TctC
LFSPAKTPVAIINRLHDEVTKVVARPDVKEKLLSTGIDVFGSTPQQLADYMKSEVAKWGKVIKAAGIRAK